MGAPSFVLVPLLTPRTALLVRGVLRVAGTRPVVRDCSYGWPVRGCW
ncbi:hypothetical protein [Streptomyces sp. NPDC056937]